MLAWHFLREDRKLRWGTEEVVFAGQELYVKPPLLMCHRGLHASRRITDAIRYAPGPVLCRVRMGGTIQTAIDKVCASERTCIWIADASRQLHEFACWCAELALQTVRDAQMDTAKASWDAIRAKMDWLEGVITDKMLADSREAAWHAWQVTAGDAENNLYSSSYTARASAHACACNAALLVAWHAARSAIPGAAAASFEFASDFDVNAREAKLLEMMSTLGDVV